MGIRITVTSDQMESHTATDANRIVIGSDTPVLQVFSLENRHIKKEHLLIEYDGSHLYAINLAKDPFTSLHGLPFGKRRLSPGDSIDIEGIEIRAEWAESPLKAPPATNQIIDQGEYHPQETRSHLLSQNSEALEELLSRVSNLPQEKSIKSLPLSPIPPQTRPSLKCDLTPSASASEEGEQTSVENSPLHVKSKPKKLSSRILPAESAKEHWRSFFVCILAGLLLFTSAMTGMYLSFSEHNETQELLVASDLTDIAMAISYATIHHKTPPNQNWINWEFLEDNLRKVLGFEGEKTPEVNSQGRFKDLPYQLRIYSHGNRFLLLAQPTPSFWQWSIPKDTVAISSSTMELHRFSDIKPLNRLLASTTPLDDVNAEAIRRFLSNTQKISLSKLGRELGKNDLIPTSREAEPPEMDYLIYNAPRYYRLTLPLIEAARIAGSYEGSSLAYAHSIQNLEEERQKLSGLPNLILYSPFGTEETHTIATILRTLFPSEEWMVASLSTTGMPSSEQSTAEATYYHEIASVDNSEGAEYSQSDESADPLPTLSPLEALKSDVREMIAERRHSLYVKRDQLITSLNHLIDEFPTSQESTLNASIDAFNAEFQSQNKKISDDIDALYQLYVTEEREISQPEFIELLAQFQFSYTPLKERLQIAESEEEIKEHLSEWKAALKAARSFENFHYVVQNIEVGISAILQHHGLSEHTPKEFYPSPLLDDIFKTLNRLIANSGHIPTLSPYTPSNRVILVEILKMIPMTPSQHAYFLSEFDWGAVEIQREEQEL